MNMKPCPRCDRTLELNKFHKDSKKPDGLFYICKDCRRPTSKSHYESNMDRYKTKARSQRYVNRERATNYMLEYLSSHPCVDCGESDVVVLEFDHVRADKSYSIARMARNGYAIKTIQAEIDKCEVVCANCHKRRTYTRCDSARTKFTGF